MWADRNWMRLSLLGLCLVLTACGDSTGTATPVPTPESTGPAANTTLTDDPAPSLATAGTIDSEVMAKWARNCALCHVRGEGGAPRLGDPDAWGDRLARGEESMLTHTIEGLNNMPPLGYCMECERDDLITLIRFMAKSA